MAESPGKPATQSQVTLQQLMMPEHANLHGHVHGGVIMKLVDETAAIAAMRHAQRPCVTVALDSMTFHSPVHVGHLLSCVANVTYVGNSSIEVSVMVHAEDVLRGEVTHTNSAYAVYVALDDHGRPHQVPPLLALTEEDAQRAKRGRERQRQRLERRGRASNMP